MDGVKVLTVGELLGEARGVWGETGFSGEEWMSIDRMGGES